MKKRLFSLIFVILSLLVACSKQQPIIIQEDINAKDEEAITLVEEEHDEDQEPQQFLEFTLSNQQVTLNIDQIPVLSNYLKQHTDSNKAIQEMQLIQIMQDEYDSLFLLSFACQKESCSYLLLDTESEQSHLLADQAKMVSIDPSPDLSNILFIFERSLPDKPWDINKLVVYNIEDWVEVTLTEDNNHLISLYTFRWPILNANWLNDDEIKIQLPDINKATNPALEEWYSTDNQPKKEMITIIN
ncbi:hypothetical protein ACS127_11340 [Amphibacillus sp. Q70]|uniref:hypothetical protein n=1 Tax=Amphibacillus sp. Q70 TaxID=3453416 RepID=UPI003F874B98